ncbi:ubiquinone biosynthesis hydrox [Patellaria atrata CBS 101060]|uniref:Ubiquinone biosynthesis monooxygenase COQ6, mitochondrial n=1 Tax=Patellaria atrata CBS 101060 TaxID=1346257 RepID=A0A9P4S5A1_9PEZI|nr:ubiquinone biosynthesis hydrox [Patellaria atrata CBS 101060]
MQYRATLWLRDSIRTIPKLQLRPTQRCRYATAIDSPELFDVVCVGGGPAGLSLVVGLRASKTTSNLKIALIESLDLDKGRMRNPSPDVYSNRCSSLTPASVRYLQEIGAWSHIDISRVQPYQEMQVWDGITGSRIAFDWEVNTRRDVQPSTIAYMIENQNLTTALQTYLEKLGDITVISPVRVDSIDLGNSTPELDLRSWPIISLSNGRRIGARLLIGADGANSPVRTFAGTTSRGWDYNRHGIVATLKLSGSGWGGEGYKIAYQRFLPTGPVAMLPLPGNMATLVWSTVPERAARLKSISKCDFLAMVNAAFRLSPVDLEYMHSVSSGQQEEFEWRVKHSAADSTKVPMEVVDVQDGSIASFPLKMRHADTYTGERVALVGDAAHTIHPLAGQGLNQGQGDVAALVSTIQAAVETGADIGSTLSLEAYNAKRYAENNAMLGVVDKLHKLYAVGSGPIVGLRSLGLKAVNEIRPLKKFFMKKAAGV